MSEAATVPGSIYGRVGVPGTLSPTGRPTLFTDAAVENILEGLARGETLTAVCRQEGMPETRTVYEWIDRMPDFANAVARARNAGADALVGEALGRLERASVGRDGTIAREREVAGHLRWMARRMAPAYWGDKVQVSAQVAVTQEGITAPAWLDGLLIEGEVALQDDDGQDAGEADEGVEEGDDVRIFT